MLPAIAEDVDKKIVNINEIHLKKYLEDLQKQKLDSGLQISDLTLDKPFRSKAFPLLQSILLNPIKAYTSTIAPQFKSDEAVHINHLLLFDGNVREYSNDGIVWKYSNKMSVKMIICNPTSNNYKLKNNKADEGIAVMRRQTWQGRDPVMSGSITYEWRKHEYKLISHDKLESSRSDENMLIEFPVLVHYFKVRTESRGVSNLKKRKLGKSDDDFDEIQFLSTSPPLANPFTDPASFSINNALSQPSEFALSDITFDFTTVPSFITKSIVPMLTPVDEKDITGTIKTYAPESAPCEDYTKVILQVNGFTKEPAAATYSCQFGKCEVPALEITPGILEFHAPPHPFAGIVYFWVVCKANNSTRIQYSSPVPFYYLPVDEIGSLVLRFPFNANESEKMEIVRKFKYSVRELDLSESSLRSIDFLLGMNNLQALILDGNYLQSNSRYPFLPKLRTLCVNSNRIDNLELFICQIERAFPSLRYLSMVGNVACPLNNEMQHRYYNYKIFIISRLPNLTHLDQSEITNEERSHAQCIRPETIN